MKTQYHNWVRSHKISNETVETDLQIGEAAKAVHLLESDFIITGS